MNAPTPLSLPQLTKRQESLTTEQYYQTRYFCDLCQTAINSSKWLLTLPKAKLEEEVILEANVLLRHCPKCRAWVCRDECWHSIYGICERCAGLTPNTLAEQVDSPEVYSSILGETTELETP